MTLWYLNFIGFEFSLVQGQALLTVDTLTQGKLVVEKWLSLSRRGGRDLERVSGEINIKLQLEYVLDTGMKTLNMHLKEAVISNTLSVSPESSHYVHILNQDAIRILACCANKFALLSESLQNEKTTVRFTIKNF